MSAPQTLLRLGVFMLLALPIVQCQAGNSTPPAAAKKDAAEKAATEKAPAQKTADAAADSEKASLARHLGNDRLDAVASDYSNISLTGCDSYQPELRKLDCDDKRFQAKVKEGLRAKIKQFHVGDIIRVEINDNGELADLRGALSVPTEGEHSYCRFLVLAACALVILGFAAVVTKGSPLNFIISEDHRYSNSRFQIALWFWVVMSTYLAVVVFRVWYAGWDFLGGVSIPQNLLVLSGLSAITYGGAKAITTSKINSATNPQTVAVAAPVASPAPVSVAVTPTAGSAPIALTVTHAPAAPTVVTQTPAPNSDPKNAIGRKPGDESLFKDLVQDDYGNFDFGDFQMVVVTLVAVAMYVSLIFHFLHSIEFLKTMSLPDVDTTILAGFGLGQGAYLAKKAGGVVGKS